MKSFEESNYLSKKSTIRRYKIYFRTLLYKRQIFINFIRKGPFRERKKAADSGSLRPFRSNKMKINMNASNNKLPQKLSELFLLISDIKQDTNLVNQAKNDLYNQIAGWIWNRIMDFCASEYKPDETLAKDIFSEVWIEILERSTSISLKLKKNYSINEEENIFFLMLEEIIERKKTNLLADEIIYAKHHFLLNEYITKADHDENTEYIEECRPDSIAKEEPEDCEEPEDLLLDADQDFVETFLGKGKIRLNNLKGDDLKNIKKWFKIETGKLKKRDKEITFEYFSIKGNRKTLENKKIAYLCKRWDTTPDNLLKIRSKTLDKLKAAFIRYVEQEQEKRKRNPGWKGDNRRT